ncbi:DNA-binding XRE family transcriptional regulator [Streptacidiphilus sp. MAP12-16]|jgi:DNA-binding XRE family transcriptional regulator|uniref:XRE family transcriptional regulator n=1 Tax=Streptacidiphilus sp. MAP12-16 TaxID=3156300 RepID=UPI0035143DBE
MTIDHLKDPQARSWRDLKNDLGFTPAEEERIQHGADRMIAEARAHRLAEVRKRQHVTQVQLAREMGITQARVSRIERGELERSEVETLAAYVRALGGKLKIVAEFGDESLVLG